LGCSQKVRYYLSDPKPEYLDEISIHDIELAKEILLTDCRKDKNREKYWDGTLSKPGNQYKNYLIDSMEIIPISLFVVNDSSKDYSVISNNLAWEKGEIIGFYSIRNGEFEGLLDWSSFHHYNLNKECNFFTIDNDEMVEHFPLSEGYKFLRDQNYNAKFLFGVKYFVNTLWFMEKGEIFVLDLKEMKVYDPDEFIKTKCYDGFIKDIANGDQVTCNY